jgi:hypothetical protein
MVRKMTLKLQTSNFIIVFVYGKKTPSLLAWHQATNREGIFLPVLQADSEQFPLGMAMGFLNGCIQIPSPVGKDTMT